jgi:hypothetical protein
MSTNPLPNPSRSVPSWLKWVFTAFMAILVPVYWANYGPTNFVYFCDASLFLALYAVWRNSALAASMAAVGIVIPQIIWCVDLGSTLVGHSLTGMTNYMFNQALPLHLRLLSLFHGWLPFLLIFLVWRLGYDRRALPVWTGLAWALCLVAFFLLPPAGANVSAATPHNVNYVFGPDDASPQHWIASQGSFLIIYMLALAVVFYVPTHFLLKKFFPAATR